MMGELDLVIANELKKYEITIFKKKQIIYMFITEKISLHYKSKDIKIC